MSEREVDLEPPNAAEDQSSKDPERSWRAESVALVGAGLVFVAALGASFGMQSAFSGEMAAALGLAIGLALAVLSPSRISVAFFGGLGWCAITSLASAAALEIAHTHQNKLTLGIGVAGLMLALPTVGFAIRRTVGGDSLQSVVSELTQVFIDPATGLAALMIGTGVALPLVGTYGPFIAEADSAWFVSSTQHVRANGMDLLYETQDVLLPQITIGPLLELGGYKITIPFMILNLVALSALTAYIGYRLTNKGAGALGASAALLTIASVLERADRLPMYAAAFFFAYGGGWLLHRAMSEPTRHRWLPFAAGAGFVLAYEAHGVGQVFVLVPFLLLLVHPWRLARRPFAMALATMAVLSVPRVMINLSRGGLKDVRSNYADFMVQKYLPVVNRDFWLHNNDVTPLGYVRNLPGMAVEAVGSRPMVLLLAIPILFAAVRSRRRARVFVVVSGLIFLVALAVTSPATFGRYLSPLSVGIAVLVGVGIVLIQHAESDGRALSRILLGALTVGAFFQQVDAAAGKAALRDAVEQGPWPALAGAVNDDKGVIGVRSHELLRTRPELQVEFSRTVSEKDWVTYLSWPSDEAVLEMMDRRGIGWVYIMPDRRLEVDYHNAWLLPAYGQVATHAERLDASEEFCLATASFGFLLYRVGPCQPGDLKERPQEFIDLFYGGVPGELPPPAEDTESGDPAAAEPQPASEAPPLQATDG